MAYCKTSARIPLARGQSYRKAEVIPNLDGAENMVSTYFDPVRDELFVFVKEKDDKYINKYTPPIFTYRSRDGSPLKKAAVWEKTKIRHIFFERENMPDGTYEYLGTSLDEENTWNANSELMEVRYTIPNNDLYKRV